jgi:phage terminase small subunit
MSILVDPRKERFAQELARPNHPPLAECYVAAGFTGTNSSRMARRPEITRRVREIQSAAAALAEIDAAWLLLKAKRLAEFNVDDFLTAPNEAGVRYFDISKASREQLAAVAELAIEESTEGRGEAAVDIRRTRIKGQQLPALQLIAQVLKLVQPEGVSLTVNQTVATQLNESARDRIAGRIEAIAGRTAREPVPIGAG